MRHFDEAYRQRAAALGTDDVPFADFWLIVNEALFDQPPRLIEPAVSGAAAALGGDPGPAA